MERPYRTDEGAFIVCPYCLAPLSEGTEALRLRAWQRLAAAPESEVAAVPCAVCALDVTCDAPLEAPSIDARAMRPCRHCTAAIVAGAVYCHHCQKWQTEPFLR